MPISAGVYPFLGFMLMLNLYTMFLFFTKPDEFSVYMKALYIFSVAVAVSSFFHHKRTEEGELDNNNNNNNNKKNE
jgi:hypothetical protein